MEIIFPLIMLLDVSLVLVNVWGLVNATSPLGFTSSLLAVIFISMCAGHIAGYWLAKILEKNGHNHDR